MSENNFYDLDFDNRYLITPDKPDDTLKIVTGDNVWFDLNNVTNTIKVNASNGLASINVNGTELTAEVLTFVAGDDIVLTPNQEDGTITIDADRGPIFGRFNITDSNVDPPVTEDLIPLSEADTLTIVAGENVNLLPNTATNTITISANTEPGYGRIEVGEEHVEATTSNDTLILEEEGSIKITPNDSENTITISSPELIAGDNISLSPDTENNTIEISASGGGSSDDPSFGTVDVDGTSLTAEEPSDTISLSAGSNITLTPDASTNSIEISATGGGGGGGSSDAFDTIHILDSTYQATDSIYASSSSNTFKMMSPDGSIDISTGTSSNKNTIFLSATGGGGSGDGVQNISYGDGYTVTPDEEYGSIYLNESGGSLHVVSSEGDPENYLTLHVPSLEGGDGITVTGSSGEYWPYWCDETETISVNVGTGLKIENGQIVPDVPALKQLLGI